MLGRSNQVDQFQKSELKKLISPFCRPEVPVVEIGYKPMALYSMQYEIVSSVTEYEKKKVIALSAIASPDSFHKMLGDHEFEIVETHVYPDHYFFRLEDIEKIQKRALELNVPIVTTEKDIVKLKRIVDDQNILFLKIDIAFIEGGEELKQMILKTIGN